MNTNISFTGVFPEPEPVKQAKKPAVSQTKTTKRELPAATRTVEAPQPKPAVQDPPRAPEVQRQPEQPKPPQDEPPQRVSKPPAGPTKRQPSPKSVDPSDFLPVRINNVYNVCRYEGLHCLAYAG